VNVEVHFADGETAVVFLGLASAAETDLVLRAWALLYQREVRAWKPISTPAQYYYDASRQHINRYDSRGYHDELADLLPIANLRQDLGKQPSSG
jgi:hypothetical protein